VFSFLRHLSMSHCPHIPAARCCCSNRSISGPQKQTCSSGFAAVGSCSFRDRQTDTVPFLPRDAMQYASAVLAIGLCLSVCLSVCLCLLQIGGLLKRLNVGSDKQHHTIAQGFQFSDAKDLREIWPGSPLTGAPKAGGVGQNRRLSTNNRLHLENGTR